MQYSYTHITLSPFSETACDIITAMLSSIGYDSFEYGDDHIKAYIPTDLFDADMLRTTLDSVCLPATTISHSSHQLEDKNWNEIWERESFDPILEREYGIRLLPRMAFGSGAHDTTHQITAMLIDPDFSCQRVLAMGPGPGALTSGAAARLAQALAPAVTDYLLPSHQGGERAHGAALAKLGLTPHLFLDIKLGEACGSSITARFLALGLAELDALHAENGDKDIDANLYLERMPAAAHSVTDRTFNFYLKTMPDLDKNAMRACQMRLDHLAKPLYSLGHLESIATEAAGIACEERPEFDLAKLLLFSTHKETEPAQRILSAASRTIPMAVTVGRLRMGLPPTAAFDFGRNTAEDLAFETSVIGLGLTDDASARLAAALLTDDGDLRYPADEFLAHVPEDLQLSVSALIGAIIATAHNSSLILPSDNATELVTRYVEELAPSVRPYILHREGTLTALGDTLPGITACAGALIVEAALAMLNHMKTFEETKVAIANDGPGAEKQKR